MSNFMKIRPVGTELFHADGQKDRRTDVTKLIIGFRNFTTAPKNVVSCGHFELLNQTQV
jgi:hypothetical protein